MKTFNPLKSIRTTVLTTSRDVMQDADKGEFGATFKKPAKHDDFMRLALALTPQEALQAIIDGKKVECLLDGLENWNSILLFTTEVLANPHNKFRLAQEMITIGDVSFPKPESEPPELGTEYWIAEASYEYYATTIPILWGDDSQDRIYLKRGFVHLTRENAIAHAKALIKLSGGNVDE